MGEGFFLQANQWSLDSHTVMFGVIGDPIKHSKSPLMLNLAFREMGLNYAYAAFRVVPEQLKNVIGGIRALDFRGINVTLPHKEEVLQYLDEIDEGARFIGAVNTIVNDGGRLIGYNTDGIGYVRSLKEETEIVLKGKRILLLGARGAARGVGYALAKEQPESIWIANRTEDKAKQLAAHLSRYVDSAAIGWNAYENIKNKVDLIINTTSVGMYPQIDEIPLDPSWLHEGITVSDILYNPLITRLLIEAREKGCTIHGGLGMFIYQGAYAFEYWTGMRAPVEKMRNVVEQSFSQ